MEEPIRRALQESRIVAVVGARQVGKTLLARRFETERRPLVSLDDIGNLTQARADPVGFIAGIGTAAIIDEVQSAPDLLLAIKATVDRDNTKGRFLLTGSANIMTLPHLADSLAGRMRILELFPLAEAEIERVEANVVDTLFSPGRSWHAVPVSQADAVRRIIRGGYPESVDAANDRARDAWFASYLLAMVQRDIREIANVADVGSMGRLLAILGARTGRIANLTSLASEAGIPKTTLIRYMALLEQTYLVHRLPAWSFELGRRLTKNPKYFLGDTGIAAHAMHAHAERLATDRNLLGGLLETFVANELRKHASWSEHRVTAYHYREHGGTEVDFVLESNTGARVAIEVKATSSPTHADARGLLKLMDDPTFDLQRGIVLHLGTSVMPIRENVHAVPLSVFWSA
jgi:predicted AAA+ superfamily ATPase